MHVNKWDIMPTVLWTCGTLKRVSNLRGKAGLPLLSLKMSVSRLFLPVYRQKTHSRSKSLWSDMHVLVRDIMPTALWMCWALERVTLSRGRDTTFNSENERFEAIFNFFWQKTLCRCKSLWGGMHVSRPYIILTLLWTCSTLERVTLSRGKAGVPLSSLKMSILKLFLPVCRQKTHCRSKSLWSDMHVLVRDIMPTALWTCGT